MQQPFEAWARSRIAGLRAEADALQRTLDSYLADQPASEDAPSVEPKSDKSHEVVRGVVGARRPGSKMSRLRQHIRDAGPDGLTLDGLAAFGAQELDMPRDKVRSNLWHFVKGVKEVIRLPDGRYAFKDEGLDVGASSPSGST